MMKSVFQVFLCSILLAVKNFVSFTQKSLKFIYSESEKATKIFDVYVLSQKNKTTWRFFKLLWPQNIALTSIKISNKLEAPVINNKY